jgi:hypothetical protein
VISDHIPLMICKVMELYEGEHQTKILVYGFEHITKKGGMCVIEISLCQLGWFHGSKAE